MSNNKFIAFLASPAGRFIAFLLVLIVAIIGVFMLYRNKSEVKRIFTSEQHQGEVVEKINTPLFSPGSGTPPPPAPAPGAPAPAARQYKAPIVKSPLAAAPVIPRLGLYTNKSPSKKPHGSFAPFGRMIKCELVNTINTTNLHTPIIGLVTEALWWDGQEIIPAGCEVHGVATSTAVRDRIGSIERWVIVYPHRNRDNGKEMILNGVVLDYNRTETGWAKTDGSAGIRGRVITNKDQQQMYLFIASFISGLGQGLISQQQTSTWGTTTTTTGGKWQDALGSALAASFKQMTDQILKELAQNLTYVEAEAGTEFYLYVRQVIDVDDADVANTNIVNPISSQSKADVRKGK